MNRAGHLCRGEGDCPVLSLIGAGKRVTRDERE
jgi:hypothetical protein